MLQVPRLAFMWKIILGVLAAGGAQSQTNVNLRLSQSCSVAGVVVDQQGKPLAEVDVDYAENQQRGNRTGAQGRFSLETRSPALVLRKPGYRSALLRTQDATNVRVILQSDSRRFPNCTNGGEYESLTRWYASFGFPRISGIEAGRQSQDIDYGMRYYRIKKPNGSEGVRHGSGPNWSSGMPSAMDVWQSVVFEETVFDAGGWSIIEARGQLADGRRWRHLGKFGETASYSHVDEATAKTLDQVMDGACLLPQARK